MARSKKKERIYKSMKEFEEKIFPKSFKKQSLDDTIDARTIGINLAKESLDTIRSQLKKEKSKNGM